MCSRPTFIRRIQYTLYIHCRHVCSTHYTCTVQIRLCGDRRVQQLRELVGSSDRWSVAGGAAAGAAAAGAGAVSRAIGGTYTNA